MNLFQYLKRNVKSNLIPGIIVVVPLVISIIVLKWLINFFDELIGPLVNDYIRIHIPGMGLLFSLILIYLVGLSTKNYIGNKLLQIGEKLVIQIPVAKTIYLAVKQVLTSITSAEEKKTQRVVMIQFPGPGIYSLGLYNGEVTDSEAGENLGSVLIITAITPASGFTVLVPMREIRFLDMPIEQMMKFVVSGGIVTPDKFRDLPGVQSSLTEDG